MSFLSVKNLDVLVMLWVLKFTCSIMGLSQYFVFLNLSHRTFFVGGGVCWDFYWFIYLVLLSFCSFACFTVKLQISSYLRSFTKLSLVQGQKYRAPREIRTHLKWTGRPVHLTWNETYIRFGSRPQVWGAQ